jgi:transposase
LEKNIYLQEHSRASVSKAIEQLQGKINKLKMSQIIIASQKDRSISIIINEEKLREVSMLDGCYVLKSNVPKNMAAKHTIHERYKDLSMVETSFRTMKQSFEEMQPIYVRKEKRTRAHVLVCSLAYSVKKYIWERCKDLDISLAGILENLNAIDFIQYQTDAIIIKQVPQKLNPKQEQILRTLKIKLPSYL